MPETRRSPSPPDLTSLSPRQRRRCRRLPTAATAPGPAIVAALTGAGRASDSLHAPRARDRPYVRTMATFRPTTIGGRSMRTLRTHTGTAILVSGFLAATLIACSPPPPSTGGGDTGTIGFALQIAPGVTIN